MHKYRHKFNKMHKFSNKIMFKYKINKVKIRILINNNQIIRCNNKTNYKHPNFRTNKSFKIPTYKIHKIINKNNRNN
jgi:hypothetical protein